MDNCEFNQAFSDALLESAVQSHFYSSINALDEKDLAGQLFFSERHKKRMGKLFAKQNKYVFPKAIIIWAKRVAVFLLIVTSLIFGTLLLNPEVRAEINRVIIEFFDEYFSIRFPGAILVEPSRWIVTYVPPEYGDQEIIEMGPFQSVRYFNQSGEKISFDATLISDGVTMGIDNENHEKTYIKVQGVEALLLLTDNPGKHNGLLWQREGYFFEIWGFLDQETLIKMAESVQKSD